MNLEGHGTYSTVWIRRYIVEDLRKDVDRWLHDVDWRFLNERALASNAALHGQISTHGVDAAAKLYEFYNAFNTEHPLGAEWRYRDVLADVSDTIPAKYQRAGRAQFGRWVHHQLDFMQRTTTDGNEYMLARFCHVYKKQICLMECNARTGVVTQRIVGPHGQGVTVVDPQLWQRPRLPDLIGLYYTGHAHYMAFVPTQGGMDRFNAESRYARCEIARERAVYEEQQQRVADERWREHTVRADAEAVRVDRLRLNGSDDALLEVVVRAIEDALCVGE